MKGISFLGLSLLFLQLSSGYSSGIIKLEPDVVHTFKYESYSKVTENENSQIVLDSLVNIWTQDGHTYFMSLVDSRFRTVGTNGNELDEKIEAVKAPVSFTLGNGGIVNFYGDPSQASWILNIKRAIIFMILNPTSIDISEPFEDVERGIYGMCRVTLSKVKETQDDGTTKILYMKDYKDLTTCIKDKDVASTIMGAPIEREQETKDFSVIDRSASCIQVVTEEGELKDVSCNENFGLSKYLKHLGLSFMAREITGKSDTMLRFVEKKPLGDDLKSIDSKDMSFMSFEIDSTMKTPDQRIVDEARDNAKIIMSIVGESTENKATLMKRLRDALKEMVDLPSFYDTYVRENSRDSKLFFLEALSSVSTDESNALMVKLIKENEDFLINKKTMSRFLHSATFTKHPSLRSLSSLNELINYFDDSHDVPNALIAASGVARKFCEESSNPEKCSDLAKYSSLIDEIAKRTSNGFSRYERSMALMALGNLYVLTPQAEEAVKQIIEDPEEEENLRATALDGYRSNKCNPSLKESTRQLMGQEETTDNLKVRAYMAMMRCPVEADLEIIKNALKENKKLGRYVKQHVKKILEGPHDNTPEHNIIYENLKEFVEDGESDSTSKTVIYPAPRFERFRWHHGPMKINGDMFYTFNSTEKSLDATPQFIQLSLKGSIRGNVGELIEVGMSSKNKFRVTNCLGCYLAEAFSDPYAFIRLGGVTLGVPSRLPLFSAVFNHQSTSTETQTPDDKQNLREYMERIEFSSLPLDFFDSDMSFPSISGLPISADINFNVYDILSLATKKYNSDVAYGQSGTVTLDISSSMTSSFGLGKGSLAHVGDKATISSSKVMKLNFETLLQNINQDNDYRSMEESKLLFPKKIITGMIEKSHGPFRNFFGIEKVSKSTNEGNEETSKPRKTCVEPAKKFDLDICVTELTLENGVELISYEISPYNDKIKGIKVSMDYHSKFTSTDKNRNFVQSKTQSVEVMTPDNDMYIKLQMSEVRNNTDLTKGGERTTFSSDWTLSGKIKDRELLGKFSSNGKQTRKYKTTHLKYEGEGEASIMSWDPAKNKVKRNIISGSFSMNNDENSERTDVNLYGHDFLKSLIGSAHYSYNLEGGDSGTALYKFIQKSNAIGNLNAEFEQNYVTKEDSHSYGYKYKSFEFRRAQVDFNGMSIKVLNEPTELEEGKGNVVKFESIMIINRRKIMTKGSYRLVTDSDGTTVYYDSKTTGDRMRQPFIIGYKGVFKKKKAHIDWAAQAEDFQAKVNINCGLNPEAVGGYKVDFNGDWTGHFNGKVVGKIVGTDYNNFDIESNGKIMDTSFSSHFHKKYDSHIFVQSHMINISGPHIKQHQTFYQIIDFDKRYFNETVYIKVFEDETKVDFYADWSEKFWMLDGDAKFEMTLVPPNKKSLVINAKKTFKPTENKGLESDFDLEATYPELDGPFAFTAINIFDKETNEASDISKFHSMLTVSQNRKWEKYTGLPCSSCQVETGLNFTANRDESMSALDLVIETDGDTPEFKGNRVDLAMHNKHNVTTNRGTSTIYFAATGYNQKKYEFNSDSKYKVLDHDGFKVASASEYSLVWKDLKTSDKKLIFHGDETQFISYKNIFDFYVRKKQQMKYGNEAISVKFFAKNANHEITIFHDTVQGSNKHAFFFDFKVHKDHVSLATNNEVPKYYIDKFDHPESYEILSR